LGGLVNGRTDGLKLSFKLYHGNELQLAYQQLITEAPHRVQLTDEDRRRIRSIARDLPSVWRAPTTTPADRKAMLRLVIEAIAIHPIDVPQRLTRIRVQWKSGAVDELTINRPDNHRTPSEAVERIRQLASLGLFDHVIATKLNAEGVRSGSGHAWTTNAVKHARLKHKIFATTAALPRRNPLPDRHPDGRYSVSGAMKRFGVSNRQLMRWVECGMVQGVREDFGGYQSVWWLTIDPETEAQIEKRKIRKRLSQNASVSREGDAL